MQQQPRVAESVGRIAVGLREESLSTAARFNGANYSGRFGVSARVEQSPPLRVQEWKNLRKTVSHVLLAVVHELSRDGAAMPRESEGLARRLSDEDAAYVRLKRVSLAREIRAKRKIYLDTKYWVLLRDVRLGRSKSAGLGELLARLEALVRGGHAICPLNADVFFEVFKQNDPLTLTASVKLLDDLSCGISLIPMTDRVMLEAFHFIEASRGGAAKVLAPDELVWTRAAYIVGFATPDHYELPDEQNVAIQKALADHMWGLKLGDFLNTIGADEAAASIPTFSDISAELNRGKLGSIGEHKSFKSLFMSEVGGVLDACKAELGDLFFTEHSLWHLLQDRNLKFRELFPCRVCSEPSDALRELAAVDGTHR